MTARIALAVAAVLLCAAFGLAIQQAHDTAAATDLLNASTPLTASRAHRVSSLLASARTLNPDRQPEILAGELALEQGHAAQARALIDRVILAEPQNITAFAAYLQASTGYPRAYLAAVIGIHRLMPPRPGHH